MDLPRRCVSPINENRSKPRFIGGFARVTILAGNSPGNANLAEALLNIADFRVWPWIDAAPFALRS
jgi:hypothetical protein